MESTIINLYDIHTKSWFIENIIFWIVSVAVILQTSCKIDYCNFRAWILFLRSSDSFLYWYSVSLSLMQNIYRNVSNLYQNCLYTTIFIHIMCMYVAATFMSEGKIKLELITLTIQWNTINIFSNKFASNVVVLHEHKFRYFHPFQVATGLAIMALVDICSVPQVLAHNGQVMILETNGLKHTCMYSKRIR